MEFCGENDPTRVAARYGTNEKTMNETKKLLSGLIAAPFTPFGSDRSLCLDQVGPFSEYLKSVGINGVFICGTTGEFPSLTVAERQQIAESWVEAGKRTEMSIVIHVGDNCLANACELAAHANALGVDGVAMVLPSYFKPTTPADAVRSLRRVSEAAGDLPLFYYHIPGLTGIQLSTAAVASLAREEIATFAGVKFSSTDLVQLQSLLGMDQGRLNILYGCDEMLLGAQVLGIDGAVGSTYNYLAPLFHRMLKAYEQGDLESAQSLQRKVVAMVDLLNMANPIASGKALLKRVGFDFGPVREPLPGLTSEEEGRLNRGVDELGIV
mgnify:CR=1 FL=1